MERLLWPLPLVFFVLVLPAAQGEVEPQDIADASSEGFPTVDQLPEIRELPNPFIFLGQASSREGGRPTA